MKTKLQVEGMTCPSCIAHVDRALREVEGVQAVEVRLREGTVTVEHDGDAAPLVEALREAGYASRAAA